MAPGTDLPIVEAIFFRALMELKTTRSRLFKVSPQRLIDQSGAPSVTPAQLQTLSVTSNAFDEVDTAIERAMAALSQALGPRDLG
jgi:hypothetical protein